MTAAACIGRDVELDALSSAIHVLQSDRGGLCVIAGQAGAGKSTIVRELARRHEGSGLEFAFGRCDEQRVRGVSLLPWRELLEDLTDLTAFEGASTGFGSRARESVVELAPDLIELLVPGVGLVLRSARLIGKNTALGRRLGSALVRSRHDSEETVAGDRSQLAHRYVSILEDLARSKPLVLVIEDIHWLDAASLQLLQAFAESAADKRMLAVCTVRPELASMDLMGFLKAQTAAGPGVFIDLDLTRETNREAFAREYLAQRAPGLDAGFIEQLVRHTNGIPLFITALIEQLMGEGQIALAGGSWKVEANLDWSALPADVEAVFVNQLSSLDDDLRELVAGASVEGETFTVEVIAALSSRNPLDVVKLLTRDRSRTIEPVGTAMLGTSRVAHYRFSHGLLRNYVLGQLPEMERIYLHESVGTALEELAGEHASEYASRLAYHFDEAGQGDRAWPYYEVAAAQARATCSLDLATQHLDRAIELAPASRASARARLLVRSANLALSSGGQLTRAEMRIREAIRLAETSPGESDSLLPAIQKELVNVLIEQNRLEDAQAVLARDLAVAGGDHEDIELLRALRSLQSRRGEAEEALETQRRIVAWSEAPVIEDEVMAADLADLAWCLKETGRNEEAHRAFERSLAIQNKQGETDWALLGRTHYALGDLLLNEERYAEARPEIEKAIEVWDRFDRKYSIGVAWNALANLENREGHFAQALDNATRAEQVTAGIVGAKNLETAFPLTCKGEALLGLGRFDESIAALSSALEIRIAAKARSGNLAWTKWLLGRAHAESDLDREQGVALVVEARAALAALGDVARSEVEEIDAWLTGRGLTDQSR